MLFNSLDFLIFFPIVFILYWFICNKNLQIQNVFILISSYYFYAHWDWRFLSLIFLSTFLDYWVGLSIFNCSIKRKRFALLLLSIFFNIGLLCYFKYYNFFIESLINSFTFFGHNINMRSLNIILPVGISFYTFQTLSYSIDIYNNKLKPTKNYIAFSAFVSFFPQLVAGPIERASNLLPQFYKKREFSYTKSVKGLQQILWGFFKKVVIADNCANFVDTIFSNYSVYPGSILFLSIILFSIQIYCDFSGYSDIAIGIARILGFSLMKNFNFPYFSRDIAEFWRRWHISLSSWFKDYIYIPLGGSRGSTSIKIRNVFIIFTVSGFWHGANWTFVAWGLINAIFFIPLFLTKHNRVNTDTVSAGKLLPSFNDFLSILKTYLLTLIAWIFFRSDTVLDAFKYIIIIFSKSFFTSISIRFIHSLIDLRIIIILIVFIIVEWINRECNYGIEKINYLKNRYFKWLIYFVLLFIILLYNGTQKSFIYFQF